MIFLARLIVFSSFLLVIAGGLVTSTDSGLSVPDWPLSYGSLFPPMVGGIRFEHTHRLIAATVGLLTLILTLIVLFKEQRRWVRRLSLFAFGLVVLQGLLGGLTVLWQLPLPVSVAHACLGQTFFATISILSLVLSPQRPAPEKISATYGQGLGVTTLAIYGQLILGALLRHAGWVAHLVAAHLLWGIVVFVLIMKNAGGVLKNFRTEPYFARQARILIWLLLLQFVLGIVTLIQGAQVGIATAHVATGALLLAISCVLTVKLLAAGNPIREPIRNLSSGLSIYQELTKPRVTLLVVITALLGFWLATGSDFSWGKAALLSLGTFWVAAGAAILNQLLERSSDAQMVRTKNRPLPSGRISPEKALAFGVFSSVIGLLLLAWGVHPLSASLAGITLVLYVFIYTPLKKRSGLCTLVGAIPGAIPPMIGWAGANGTLDLGAWLLFAILFLWQLPHFLAIAWLYREDYARAGFQMLPVLDPEGGTTARQIALYSLALIPVSLLPAVVGLAGWFYFSVAFISSFAFFGFGLATARARSGQAARRLFLASIVYLPFLLTTLTLDRVL